MAVFHSQSHLGRTLIAKPECATATESDSGPLGKGGRSGFKTALHDKIHQRGAAEFRPTKRKADLPRRVFRDDILA